MEWVAITAALGSAMVTALSTSVQHIAAGDAPESVSGATGLLQHLFTRPLWLFGQALAVSGFAFHATALHNGPISLVQPIIISGIVFAVPLRAAFAREFPHRPEVLAVALTAGALAVFLTVSNPSNGIENAHQGLFAVLVAITAAVAFITVTVARRTNAKSWRSFLLGVSSGLLFGLVAVLLKACQGVISEHGASGLLTAWQAYGTVAMGLSGVAINQLAYRTARLSATMPILNVVDCLLALAFGYFIFEETPRHDPLAIAIQAGSLAAMCVGLWVLARFEEPPVVTQPANAG